MRKKTYDRMVRDVTANVRDEASTAASVRLAELQPTIERIVTARVDKHFANALEDKVAGEDFLDSIIDRIMRKQLDGGRRLRRPTEQ